MDKIKQAVILAGGLGTRLRPITYSLPKPMVNINKRPFLEYLIKQCEEQGFEDVLILLGYMPEIIIDYLKGCDKFNINIHYHVSPVEADTGMRLRLARDEIKEDFLLMYCDNYWPMNISNMIEEFNKNKMPIQTTVYSNPDNYTKNNVMVKKSRIVKYDKSRLSDGLNGVDIGYALIRKDVINILPDENVNFEGYLYPFLVEKKKLAAYITEHKYYSIGSHERLEITERFFNNQKTIILDRDGVINKKPNRGEYVTTWDDFHWIDGSIKALKLLKEKGFRIILVTNQAGIARGVMNEDSLSDIHTAMKSELRENGVTIDAIYHCPHGWDDACNCRKPKPGMLFMAQRDFDLNLADTYFIGDDIRDMEAGNAAGCKTILATPDRSLLQIVKEKIIHA